jgi:hypothetical protein
MRSGSGQGRWPLSECVSTERPKKDARSDGSLAQ